MIEKEKIGVIKRTVDIKSLIESKGIHLKKNGKGYFGRCPFHDDKTPSLSVNIQENLWQCFGCDKGGDVIRFVELFDQVDFKEAVKRLSGDSHDIKNNHSTINTAPESPSMQDNPQTQQYLERVVAIYENNFTTKAGAKKYLESRNITDAGLFTKHAVGFCDGTLNEILPKNGGIRDTLKQIGILLDNGSERFKNCVVFPVYDVDGHLITLYGRHIDDASGKKHVFLPNRPTGLWNSNIIKTCSEIILTESVIDALSVQMAGFNNVVSIQSTNGLSDQDIRELKTYGVNKIILLLDGDPPGTKASERLKKKLSDFMVDIRSLPDNHDPNSFLIKHGPQKLAELIQSSSPVPGQNPAPEQAKEEQQSLSGPVPPQPPPSDGFVIACGMRQYQIMSLDKGAHKLKVTIRLEHRGKLHVKPRTINTYIEGVKGFLTWLADNGHMRKEYPEIVRYVKKPVTLPGSVLPHAKMRKMLSCIPTNDLTGYRDRAMLELLYSTGVRAAELLGLNTFDVDFRNKTMMVTGKGNKQRVVPIGRTAIRHIETYLTAIRPYLLQDHGENAFFLNGKGKRLKYRAFLKSVHIHSRRMGYDDVSPHTFRRSCATELVRSGANMYHVKELLGHESLDTLKHYTNLTINDLKKTHEKCHPRERDRE
jgi:DNA primase catalytic core